MRASTDLTLATSLGACAAFLLDAAAAGQAPVLVADLNPMVFPSGGAGSAPSNLVASGEHLFFAALGLSGGVEPFMASVSPLGAVALGDLRIGGLGAFPAAFTPFGSGVAFVADDGLNGPQLWIADGGGSPPVRVTAIARGVLASELAVLNGRVYFAATDLEAGTELWSSDGTPGGAARLPEIRPGASGSDPNTLAVSAGRLYFLANDGTHGQQLWAVDGPGAQPVMMTDLVFGAGGGLFGVTPAKVDGREGVVTVEAIYSSGQYRRSVVLFADASSAGVATVYDTNTTGERIQSLLPVESGVLAVFIGFTFFDTRPGVAFLPGIGQPRLVLGGGPLADDSMFAATLAPVLRSGDRGFFTLDRSRASTGIELWMAGTSGAAPRRVPEADAERAFNVVDPVLTPAGIYFSASRADVGTELFRADACGRHVTLVADINPGPAGSVPQELALVRNTLFFRALGPAGGQELWALTLPFNPDCRADVNADGRLDADDLGDFITAYFTYEPGADATGVDFNGDCDVNADDLGDYITAYFEGCV